MFFFCPLERKLHIKCWLSDLWSPVGADTKVGIPNFVSGPREYIMEGEYVILAMCSWFRIS